MCSLCHVRKGGKSSVAGRRQLFEDQASKVAIDHDFCTHLQLAILAEQTSGAPICFTACIRGAQRIPKLPPNTVTASIRQDGLRMESCGYNVRQCLLSNEHAMAPQARFGMTSKIAKAGEAYRHDERQKLTGSIYSYNRYLAVAARVVRRSLKEDKRLQAERRGEMDLRFAKWEVSISLRGNCRSSHGRVKSVRDCTNRTVTVHCARPSDNVEVAAQPEQARAQ